MAKAVSKNKKIDWERVEMAYRANMLSVNQLANNFGIAESTLRARAKREGWKRDLKRQIKFEADKIVNEHAITREVNRLESLESETVEQNAQLTAGVRLSHRQDIARARDTTLQLLDDLQGQVGSNRERLDDLLLRAVADGVIHEDVLQVYERVTSLPSHVKTMKDLSDSLSKLVTLERQAWGLDDDDSSPQDALTSLLHAIGKSNNNAFGVVGDDPEYIGAPASSTLSIKGDDDE
ncbi:terminase small subunit [Shewanella phage vB_SbaS_Y11]|nr:terminase small subunit [Shewanella phage vB_SbaS_Y11]